MKVLSVRGKKVTVELTDQEEGILFRAGLQLLIDKWFGKKVVVLPVEKPPYDLPGGRSRWFDTLDGIKKVEVDDEFCRLCVQEAFNQALREYLGKTGKFIGAGVSNRKPKAMTIGPEFLVHKAKAIGFPEALCGVKKSRQTSVNWEEVTCSKCRKTS